MSDNSQYPEPEEMERRKSSDRVRQLAIDAAERGATASKTAASGLISLLARRTGRSVEEIAEKIPEDTIRRTRYPVVVQENDDGTLTFKDPVVVPGKELIHAPTTPGAKDKQEVERGGIGVKVLHVRNK